VQHADLLVAIAGGEHNYRCRAKQRKRVADVGADILFGTGIFVLIYLILRFT
jgi:hypothetical protein